jgi:CSLREA domain-containing protein
MSPSPVLHVRARTLSFISICTVLAIMVLVWTSRQSAASTITVNSLSDVTNGSDGLCTLREAITAANSNAASGRVAGECAASGGSG